MKFLEPLDSQLLVFDDHQRTGWARLAVLNKFDRHLFDFVVPNDELIFSDVIESPLVERLGGPAQKETELYRLKSVAAHAFLRVQPIDSAWLIAQTAGLAAVYFGGKSDKNAKVASDSTVERIRYLSLAEPEASRLLLCQYAKDRLRAGEHGASVAASSAAMYWIKFQAFLGDWTESARYQLKCTADLIHALALLTSMTDTDDLTGRARILQVALARTAVADSGAELWLLDSARNLLEAHAKNRIKANREREVIVHGIDDWAIGLALVANWRAVAKQTHEVTVVSDTIVRQREETTIQLDGYLPLAGQPVPIGLLPASLGSQLDLVQARDARGAMLPTLGLDSTYRLLAIAAIVDKAFPPPGDLACQMIHPQIVYKDLDRMLVSIERALRTSSHQGEGNGHNEMPWPRWLTTEARDSLVRLLDEFRNEIPVIAIFDAAVPAVQVVSYEVDLPVAGRRSSRRSGQTKLHALACGFEHANQQVTVTAPEPLVPIGVYPSALEHQTTAPAGESTIQRFRLAPSPGERSSNSLGGRTEYLTFEYGIAPLHRLKTIGFALLAIALFLFALEAPNALADLSVLNTLGFVTLVTSIGGLIEVAAGVLRHRTGRFKLPRRVTQMTTGLAWFVFVVALVFLSAGATQSIVKAMLWLVPVLAGSASIGEGLQLLIDVQSQRRFEHETTEPLKTVVGSVRPELPSTKGAVGVVRRALPIGPSAPRIISVTPHKARIGDTITISGVQLFPTTAGRAIPSITVGGISAADVAILTRAPDTLTATVVDAPVDTNPLAGLVDVIVSPPLAPPIASRNAITIVADKPNIAAVRKQPIKAYDLISVTGSRLLNPGTQPGTASPNTSTIGGVTASLTVSNKTWNVSFEGPYSDEQLTLRISDEPANLGNPGATGKAILTLGRGALHLAVTVKYRFS